MTTQELQEVVKEIMGKDPIEMVINYYKGLIQISVDRIAEEQNQIIKFQEHIDELAPNQPTKANKENDK